MVTAIDFTSFFKKLETMRDTNSRINDNVATLKITGNEVVKQIVQYKDKVKNEIGTINTKIAKVTSDISELEKNDDNTNQALNGLNDIIDNLQHQVDNITQTMQDTLIGIGSVFAQQD